VIFSRIIFHEKVTVKRFLKKVKRFHEKWYEEKSRKIKDFGHEESVGFAMAVSRSPYNA